MRVWHNAWDNVAPFFQFPPEIRKITYTANAIESLNMSLCKYTRNRRIFPNGMVHYRKRALVLLAGSLAKQ